MYLYKTAKEKLEQLRAQQSFRTWRSRQSLESVSPTVSPSVFDSVLEHSRISFLLFQVWKVLFSASFSYTVTPYAPYWVLSTDYNSIALVYSCTDVLRLFHVDYAWILARSRILPAEAIYHAKEIFSRDNIDVSKMTATDQQGCDGPI